MDKLQAQRKNDDQRKSDLFKQLFLFQTELEKYDDDRFQYQLKIRETLELIDELMGLLIEETESNHL